MEALRIHDALRNKLQLHPIKGTVHSIFQKALNLMDEENHLYTLLSEEMDDGPMAVTLPIRSFETLSIKKNQELLLTKEAIYCPSQRFSLEKAVSFSLSFPSYDPSPWCYGHIEETENLLERENLHGTSPFEKAMDFLLKERLREVLESFHRNDPMEIAAASKKLLGLGPGLTPSGDDILLGILLVLNLPGNPYKKHLQVFVRVLEEAGEETNYLSLQGLKRAQEGYVRRILLDFIRAILEEKDIEKERQKVIGIGHTSGQDILRGVLSLLKICLEKE